MASVTKSNDESRTGPEDDPSSPSAADEREPGYLSKKGSKSKTLAEDEPDNGDDRIVGYARPIPSGPSGRGYFTIYKRGQGYWTRMGTVIGAGILGIMLAYTLYDRIPGFFYTDNPVLGRKVGASVAGGFIALFAILAWWLMNKPDNVDFLIATDTEMKKVNWTSRRELIGSTKVVIFFMFLIAVMLFLLDIFFMFIMWGIGVLKNPWGTLGGG